MTNKPEIIRYRDVYCNGVYFEFPSFKEFSEIKREYSGNTCQITFNVPTSIPPSKKQAPIYLNVVVKEISADIDSVNALEVNPNGIRYSYIKYRIEDTVRFFGDDKTIFVTFSIFDEDPGFSRKIFWDTIIKSLFIPNMGESKSFRCSATNGFMFDYPSFIGNWVAGDLEIRTMPTLQPAKKEGGENKECAIPFFPKESRDSHGPFDTPKIIVTKTSGSQLKNYGEQDIQNQEGYYLEQNPYGITYSSSNVSGTGRRQIINFYGDNFNVEIDAGTFPNEDNAVMAMFRQIIDTFKLDN